MAGQIQQIETAEVFGFLESRPEGLDGGEVDERLRQLGPNILDQPRKLWWLPMLVRQFANFFSLLLDISAGICFVADRIQPGEHMDVLGAALFGVSILNSLFSFLQEYRAERAMEELNKLLPKRVVILRGGEKAEIDADDVVPGDVLLIRAGDRVPADARLVESDHLLVSNAALSGESRPVALSSEACDCELPESPNVLFAGCTVLQGAGSAVVYATGFRTEFGKIALLSSRLERKVSPLERETTHMVRILTVIAVGMGLAFFAYGVYTGRSLWTNLVFMMGIIVANVPEGLLPTFTLSLAMAAKRMARKKVLIKGLNAVETMGAVHVVCTDKTGTLTENRLAITRVIDGVAGVDIDASERRRAFLGAAAVASQAEKTRQGFSGDSLDVCVVELYGEEIGNPADAIEPLRFFPFEQQRLHTAGIARFEGKLLFAAKGAWESLRPLVAAVAGADGQSVPADAEVLARTEQIVHELSSEGFRLLAVASRQLEAEPDGEAPLEQFEQGLTLDGFLIFEDPLRKEVPGAVARCHEAGIRVIMITGDHPDTAGNIARRAGIRPPGEEDCGPIITGAELATMRESELIRRLAEGCVVFARTSPEQKMKIVSALHEMEMVVAVTGDGVNDAPALKGADVGIAMGLSGTEVAREAAQVILLDDNFASIVAGIEEGRTIFANIRKFTNYVLVSNGPEIIPYLIYIIFPVPLALTVIQILLIDLGTDIIPSMALGQEPSDKDVMQQPPRRQGNTLLTWPLMLHSYLFLGLIEAVFALALFFWVLTDGGWHYGQSLPAADPLYHSATGITLASIMLMQIGNLIGRRSATGSGLDTGIFRNPLLLIGIGLEIFFSWAVLYLPIAGDIIGTGPVSPGVYAVAVSGIAVIFGLDYLRKRLVRPPGSRRVDG
jgi:sodium/potassium-transporting ATPase subunit alpha